MIRCPVCRRALKRAETNDEDWSGIEVSYVHETGDGEDPEEVPCAVSSVVLWYRGEDLLEAGLDATEAKAR